MALNTDLQNIVGDVFTALSDLNTSCTYRSKSGSYAPGTGVVTDSSTTETVNAILTSFEQRDIDGLNVHGSDRKALIPNAEIIVDPVAADEMVINSVTWNVIGVKVDPALALWILHLRRQ